MYYLITLCRSDGTVVEGVGERPDPKVNGLLLRLSAGGEERFYPFSALRWVEIGKEVQLQQFAAAGK